MSHTNTTTNYGLPQFLSSDKPAWMADINVAFADIDAQMKTNADAASAAQTTADDAVLNGAPGYSNLSTYAVGDVVNYLGRVYKCDIAVTTPEAFDNAKWSYYRLSDASAQIDVIDGEIGSTDISSIGDGSITGAISSVNGDLVDLEYITQLGYISSTTPITITLSDAISNYRWLYVALVLNDNHYAPTLIPTAAIVSQQILISSYDGSNHIAYFTKTSDTTIYGVSDTSGYSLAFWGVGKK